MRTRTLFPLIALLALPMPGRAQEHWGYPDVWKSAGTKKVPAAEIQTLVAQLGPGVEHRMGGCFPVPEWGKGSKADEAAAQLVQIGSPALPRLLPLLNEKEPRRRRLLVEILGRIGNQSVTRSLLSLLQSETDDSVRESAAESVAMLRDAWAEDALIQALQDKSAWVQQDAARGLGWLQSTRAIEPLTSLLRKQRDAGRFGFGRTPAPDVAAANALGMIGEPALPALLDLLSDPATSPATLAVAVMPASGIGDQRVVPVLLRLLDYPDDAARYATLNALAKYPDALTVSLLSHLLRDTSQTVRCSAAVILVARNTAESRAALEKALADPDNVVQRDTAVGLDYVTSPDAVPMLIRVLKTGVAAAQHHAALPLALLKDKRAIDPLLNALASSDAELRRVSAAALGYFDDPLILAPLIKALDDPEPGVRIQRSRLCKRNMMPA